MINLVYWFYSCLHRFSVSGRRSGKGGYRHSPARSDRQAHRPALVEDMGTGCSKGSGYDIHHRHWHPWGGKGKDQGVRRQIQYPEGEGRAWQWQGNDKHDTGNHRPATCSGCQSGMEGQGEGSRWNLLAIWKRSGDGGAAYGQGKDGWQCMDHRKKPDSGHWI